MNRRDRLRKRATQRARTSHVPPSTPERESTAPVTLDEHFAGDEAQTSASERSFFDTSRQTDFEDETADSSLLEGAEGAEGVHDRAARFSAPAVASRRRRATAYVALVAAACVAIVGVASARVASRGAAASQSKPDSAPSLALAAPTTPDALPASPPAVTQHAEPSAAPARVVEAPPEPSETTRDPVEAKRKKRESQSLLERGKAGAAIDAGEAAVALDPEDAEAWLILGAAYQQKGDAKRAREAFSQCLKQGKRGPKAECAAMLR